MFHGYYCRYYSKTEDQNIGRQLGTQNVEHFILDRILDAATPDQLEGLAFQFLSQGRRCKTSGNKDYAAIWKEGWRKASEAAEAARLRLSAMPTKASAPHLYNPRTPGKPGHLDSDFNLPFYAQIDFTGLEVQEISTGTYNPRLKPGITYKIGPSRLGKTWLSYEGYRNAFEIDTRTLRGLQQTGRLVPVETPAKLKFAS